MIITSIILTAVIAYLVGYFVALKNLEKELKGSYRGLYNKDTKYNAGDIVYTLPKSTTKTMRTSKP